MILSETPPSRRKIHAIKCDKCHSVYSDMHETQEFLIFEDTCGYGNKTFGDMSRIEVHLCQYCVKDVLGDYIKVTKNEYQL